MVRRADRHHLVIRWCNDRRQSDSFDDVTGRTDRNGCLEPGRRCHAVINVGCHISGPFWIAGIYGTLADAVNGQTITWSTFWRNARILYGRGWGLIGFSALWALSIDIIMLVFGLLLHALGIVLGFAWVIATLPVIMRMTGGCSVAAYLGAKAPGKA